MRLKYFTTPVPKMQELFSFLSLYLSLMGELAPNDGFALLGIGLACSGVAQIASA